jgi:hypothetical protein
MMGQMPMPGMGMPGMPPMGYPVSRIWPHSPRGTDTTSNSNNNGKAV